LPSIKNPRFRFDKPDKRKPAETYTNRSDRFFLTCDTRSQHNSEPVKKAEEADVQTRKSRILVMDDEEMVRNILTAMLHTIGHEVLFAKDGIEAVQVYREAMENDAPIDLIIMDLTIQGGMGGKEAVQKILAINPEAKVVVSSGYSNDPVMANFKDYGFCSAIAKPYQLSELTKVISQQVD